MLDNKTLIAFLIFNFHISLATHNFTKIDFTCPLQSISVIILELHLLACGY